MKYEHRSLLLINACWTYEGGPQSLHWQVCMRNAPSQIPGLFSAFQRISKNVSSWSAQEESKPNHSLMTIFLGFGMTLSILCIHKSPKRPLLFAYTHPCFKYTIHVWNFPYFADKAVKFVRLFAENHTVAGLVFNLWYHKQREARGYCRLPSQPFIAVQSPPNQSNFFCICQYFSKQIDCSIFWYLLNSFEVSAFLIRE